MIWSNVDSVEIVTSKSCPDCLHVHREGKVCSVVYSDERQCPACEGTTVIPGEFGGPCPACRGGIVMIAHICQCGREAVA